MKIKITSTAMKVSSKLVILICFLAAFVSGDPHAKDDNKLVSKRCLNCLCVASTGCDKNIKCEGPVCGPYRISLPYWLDAGKPKVDDDETESNNGGVDGEKMDPYSEKSYRDCANNLECASRAVEGYMERYARDCDGDDIINCDDFARIHRNGPEGCTSPLDDRFKRDYEKCIAIE